MIPSPFDTAARRLAPSWWSKDTFDAIDNVSISITAGSAVGVVGHNGAGKTTLLKLIADVTSPTSGSTRTQGRLVALLDVLVGFHPELTGRENAYLLGAMLGIGRKAMARLTDRAMDFAELDLELVDTPVKRYSAGMISRLAFGVVSAVEPDILLVDEVLSVGDAAFQRKCINWLDQYRTGEGTLVFVSHNLGLVRSMAERVIWLDHGRVVADDSTERVLPVYARALEHRGADIRVHRKAHVWKQMQSHGLDRWGAGGVRVEEVHLEDPAPGAEQVDVWIRYETRTTDGAFFCVGFEDDSNREVGAASSPLVPLPQKRGSIRCSIKPVPFWPGIYFPVVAIVSANGQVEDRWKLDRALVIDGHAEAAVTDSFGPVKLQAEWVNGTDR
jgi:ABC-type polysaccharide/polyol phosphate transport system ATPase subunit